MSRTKAILDIRERLFRRRKALRKSLSLTRELIEAPSGVGDSIDAAIDSEHREVNSQLADIENRELVSVESALERIREGTYGVCEQCGRSIPLARLRAIPYATLCIQCQRETEKGRRQYASSADWQLVFEVNDNNGEEVVLNGDEVTVL